MSRFRLAGLLRVRSLQEERARAQLAAANAGQARAAHEVERRQDALARRRLPTDGPSWLFLTQVATRSAMAAEVSAAGQARDLAREAAELEAQEWRSARADARALGRLAERHEDLQRRSVERAAQAEADDRAATVAHSRSHEPASPPQEMPRQEVPPQQMPPGASAAGAAADTAPDRRSGPPDTTQEQEHQ